MELFRRAMVSIVLPVACTSIVSDSLTHLRRADPSLPARLPRRACNPPDNPERIHRKSKCLGLFPFTMDHAARVVIAKRVTDFLIRRHPEAVAVWIEGSTAKGEDRIHSDLEMGMATRGESGVRSYQCIFEDIVVEVGIESEEAALRQASLVDSNWPMWADGYVRALATYDPEGLVPRLAALAGNPDPAKVSRALVSAFTGMHEDLCKVRNFAISKEEPLLRLMSMGFALHGVARFVGLLNRQYFNGIRNLVTKPREFAKLPPHFWEDFPRLLAADGPAKELLARAERMHAECRELLSASGNAPSEGLSIEQALELGRLPRSG